MKFSSSTLCGVLVLCSLDASLAFVTPASARSSSVLKATTLEPQTALKPPVDLSKSQEVQDLYGKHVQTTYGRYPLTFSHGQGCKLFLAETGEEYLDFVSGIATCALGHANPALTDAIRDQMSQVHHVSNLYYIPAQAALAKWLCDNSQADKVFFCNSGAESNEAAIKLARRHASNRGIVKPVIITAEQSFHGRSLAALTATAQPKYHKGFGYDNQMVPGFEYVPYNDPQALEAKVQEIASSDRGLAAIMMEPLQGEGGIVPGQKEFFDKARQLCDETGALLMCDEVQVGMGRSGTLWGHQQLGVTPDVFTSAKALGGGVPIGAMMARGEAATVFGPGDHASTYGGNPLACRAGLAVAQYMCENNVLENVQARGAQLRAGLEALTEKYPDVVNQVRGWGLLQGIQIAEDCDLVAGDLVGAAMEEKLLLVPAGVKVVRFVPPLIVTEDEVQQALDKFEAAIVAKVKKE